MIGISLFKWLKEDHALIGAKVSVEPTIKVQPSLHSANVMADEEKNQRKFQLKQISGNGRFRYGKSKNFHYSVMKCYP